MMTKELFGYLKSLIKSGTSPFPIESIDISYGDRYYNEDGEDLRFEILGKKYSVGYSYITEDADDWAQAECHQVEWCDCDEKSIDKQIVYDLIQSYKSEVRDSMISEIIK